MNDRQASLSAKLRAAGEGADRVIEVTASTGAVDDYGTILRGWELDRFLRNPVILWNHRRMDLPIGSAADVRVDGDELKMSIRLVDATANPLAEQIWNGVRQESIRGVSVGFDLTARTSIREEMRDGQSILVVEGLELYEVSLCTLQSNPETVVTSFRSALGLGESSLDLKDITELRSAVARVTGKESLAEMLGALDGLREAAEAGRAAQTELATLRADKRESEVVSVIAEGEAAGKVLPSTRGAYLRACGAGEDGKGADPLRLRALVEALPVAVVVDAKPAEVPAETDRAAAEKSEVEKWIERAMGSRALEGVSK